MSTAASLETIDSHSVLFFTLLQHAKERPTATALTELTAGHEAISTSYNELALRARQFAEKFRKIAPEGATIFLLLSKGSDCVAAMLGALGAGRAFSCLSHKLRAPQLASLLAGVDSALLLLDSAGLNSLRGLGEDVGLSGTDCFLIKDSRFSSTHERAAETLSRIVSLREWTQDAVTDCAQERICLTCDPSDETRCVLYTSGSTGCQKGVRISEQNLIACAEAEVELYGLSDDDALLSVLPFAFDVGLMQLLSGLHAGASIVFLNSWLPGDLLRAAAEHSISGISGVPSIWEGFLSTNCFFDTDDAHRSLRYLTISGGDLSEYKLRQLARVAGGLDIYKTYGQSETFRSTALLPSQFRERPTSVGKAFGSCRFYVVRKDGKLAKPREVGEVVHTGPGTMLGYVGAGDAKKLRRNPYKSDIDPAPFAIFTGDLGWVDEQGFLFLHGRRDDLVKINGNRVHLCEVRNGLCQIEEVGSAEVVAIRSDVGVRLAAFLVPIDGVSIDESTVGRSIRRVLPPYMIPELFTVRDGLPTLPNGKPDRERLVEEAEILFSTKTLSVTDHIGAGHDG